MIKEELEKIRNKGEIDVQKNYNTAMILGTQNSIMTFMKKTIKNGRKHKEFGQNHLNIPITEQKQHYLH